MNLQELGIQEQELRNLLAENHNKQKELRVQEFIKKHGINIGDTVEWEDLYIKKGVISKIEFSGNTPRYYHAYLFNADGKVGKREVRIWNNDLKTIKKII